VLEKAANEAHEVGFSSAEGDCLTNIKVIGEWASATWPAAQPQALVFRHVDGAWRAVMGGTAIQPRGTEGIPRAILEGQP